MVNTCGVRSDNTAWCWHAAGNMVADITQLPGADWLSVAINTNLFAGIKFDGAMWVAIDSAKMTQMPGSDYTMVSLTGNNRVTGIRGVNELFETSPGGAANTQIGAVQVATGSFVAVAATEVNSCALQSDGQVFCFNGPNVSQLTPLSGGRTFASLSAGINHFLAIAGTPVCLQITERRTSTACPSNQTGVITEERTKHTGGICGAYGNWAEVSNTCAPAATCVLQRQTNHEDAQCISLAIPSCNSYVDGSTALMSDLGTGGHMVNQGCLVSVTPAQNPGIWCDYEYLVCGQTCTQSTETETTPCGTGFTGNQTRTRTKDTGNVCGAYGSYSAYDRSQCVPASIGVCGSDGGAMLTSAPTNLCSSGTASTVNGNDPWNWTCTGTDNTPVPCQTVPSSGEGRCVGGTVIGWADQCGGEDSRIPCEKSFVGNGGGWVVSGAGVPRPGAQFLAWCRAQAGATCLEDKWVDFASDERSGYRSSEGYMVCYTGSTPTPSATSWDYSTNMSTDKGSWGYTKMP